jgi:Raf kinase inhibitor-like YbhB/YbcL family protein
MVTFDAPSPPLEWAHLPPGTASLALTVQDLEMSEGGNPLDGLIWIVVNIKPNGVEGLPEGVARGRTAMLPEGAFQHSYLTNGYIGPGPGTNVSSHHYLFQLFPLDSMLKVPRDVTYDQLLAAMEGHFTGGKAVLIATCCVGSR